jgi:hypothetical protein
MKTVYHFGDSYGVVPQSKTFVELAANKAGYNYHNQSVGGFSNEMILNTLLRSLNLIKPGDVVFINFSFFVRGCWYDEKTNRVRSTNELYQDVYSSKQYLEAKGDNIVALVEYYLKYTKDYSNRLFTLVNSTLEYLTLKGIKVFYIFLEDLEWTDRLLNVGTSVKFSNGFCKWLQKNKLHLEEEGHYSKGIQPFLASLLLTKTDEFRETSKTVFIDDDKDTFKITLLETASKTLI